MNATAKLFPLVAMSFMLGCAGPNHTVGNVLGGAAIGAAGGALIGAAAGHHGAGAGALIGAGVGAVAGFVYDQSGYYGDYNNDYCCY